MISTRNLSSLPDIETLRRLLQSLALLDAIIEDEWDYRYYSFNAAWSDTEQIGSMRNGSGDDFFAVFDTSGCFLRGFDHESTMSPWNQQSSGIWPGVLEKIPPEFKGSVNEPAFHIEDTTFCIWRLTQDSAWSHGPVDFPTGDDPDGSEWMLSILDGKPEVYQIFAKEYFELDLSINLITRIYSHEPLSQELFNAFSFSRNIKRNFQDVIKDAKEIGYPLSKTLC